MDSPFHGVYAVLDVESVERRRLGVVPVAEALLAGGARVLQLRAKERAAGEILAWLRQLVPLTERDGVPLMANDRPDLARLAGCAGVHVGQEDVPVEEVRRTFGELRVGVSTHDLEQLDAALNLRPDYVALGPIFETRTKANPDPTVGIDVLRKAARRAARAGLPLVAIGGIDHANVAEVGAAGASPAVVAALLPNAADDVDPYEDIARRTRRLVEVWERSFRNASRTVPSDPP